MRVAHNIVEALLRFAERRGFDRRLVLDTAGLDQDSLRAVEERVPAATLYALHRALDQLTADSCWALSVVDDLPKGAYGLAEYIFRCQETLLESFQAIARYFALVSDVSRLRVVRGTANLVLEATHVDPEVLHTSLDRTLYQNLLSAVLHVAREITDAHLTPTLVEFPFDRDHETAGYARAFGTVPRFSRERAALHFDASAAASPIRAADPNLKEILERHAEELLERHSAEDEFVASVQRVVLGQLHGGDTSLETIGRKLGISTRSVQRRLAESGLTFQGVLTEMRYRMATRCLVETRYSIDEIAFLLGYADNSAFVKAFKRWAKVTPGQYRARHQAA